MIFTSVRFILFLTVIFIVYHLVPQRFGYIILIFANYVFCFSWGLSCAFILLAITMITYIGALLIEKSRKHDKLILFLILTLVISILLVFKFIPVFTSLISIIGISFYSLQAMGYLIDVYYKKIIPELNFLRYSSFISFFPTFTSGPIQRSTGLLSQIRIGTVFSYDLAKSGALMMLLGYFEKILIADRIHILVGPIFEDIYSQNGAVLLFGCLMYGIELYADFAGYSLIAIGTARLLGFDLEDNFRQPYFAAGIKDFWRRWHISLSTWLRDYIYIPLGGNRKGTMLKYINLTITFFISGIWHGNGFKFVAWGLLHGIYQVAGSFISSHKKNTVEKSTNNCQKIIKCLFTFILVQLGWIFFRAASLKDVFIILKRIIFDLHLTDTIVNQRYLAGYEGIRFVILLAEIIILFIIDYLHEKKISIIKSLSSKPAIIRWSFYILITTILITGALYNYGMDSSTFIYAQF